MVIVVILAFLESNNLSRIYIYLCIWQNSICAWADSPVRRESSFVVSCFHFILSIQKQISNLTRYIANNQRKSCMKVCLTAGFSMLSLWFYPLTRYVRPCLVCWSMRLCVLIARSYTAISEHLLLLEDLVRWGWVGQTRAWSVSAGKRRWWCASATSFRCVPKLQLC